jgi:hypothetical protein
MTPIILVLVIVLVLDFCKAPDEAPPEPSLPGLTRR